MYFKKLLHFKTIFIHLFRFSSFIKSGSKLVCFISFFQIIFFTPLTALSGSFSLTLTGSDYNGFGVSCNGASDGSVDLEVTGGSLPLQYNWSNGSTVEDISGLASDWYIVTVIDAVADTVIDSIFISEPDPIELNLVTMDANNAPDGEASVSPSGGAGGFAYLWSTTETTSAINSLLPGNYTITVTDVNSCTETDVAVIQNALGACTVITDSVKQVTCFGLNNGAIYIDVFAAIPPVTYQWSNGASSQDVTGLAPGTYTVTITDLASCTATETFVITEPAVLGVSLTPTSATCGLNNGSITSTPSGGTSPYGYLWSGGQTTPGVNALAPGNYTLTVTDSNGCIANASTPVGSLPPPVLALDSVRHVRCFGGLTGGVFVSLAGGASPFSYQWSNGATTQDISGVASGSYTVTVTDANLCTSTLSAAVNQPAAALNDSVHVTNATCGNNNGAVTVFPYAGTSPYTFLWNTGATSQTITGLAPASYTVTITDANLCTRQRTSGVTGIPVPVAVLDSVRHVRCFGQSTGGVFISVTGGTSPYTYQWTGGATGQDISNVATGTYTVTVTDASLCTSTLSATVNQPAAALNDSVQVTNSTCGNSNGAVTVYPYAGTSPYTYQWNTGATSQTISGLAAASYTVTITDANLCTRQRTASVLNIPGPVAVLDSVRHVRCFGQSTGGVFISVTGGTSPFTYQWTGGATSQDIINVVTGTYTVTVTDANLCTSTLSASVNQPAAALNDSVQVTNATCGSINGSVTVFPYGGTSPYTYLWNTGATSQSISGLAAATYTVTITDANNCTRQRTSSVISSPGPIAALDSIRHVRCFGQSTGGVYISVSGGTAPLTYQWTGGSTSQDLINAATGTYTVTVTDGNLCTSTLSATVNQPAAALNDSVQITKTTCGNNNGSVTVYPYGGTPGYTYLWSNAQTTQTISGLSTGSYTVTITDANLCTRQRTAIVGATAFPVVVLDSIRNVKCFGGTTGGVFISAPGSALPVVYQWSNGASSSDLVNVAAGTYTVTVTDANNCTATNSGTVMQPAAALNDSVQISHVTCAGNNGSITVYPYGGTSPYTYLWSTFATTQTITNLSVGNYTVRVTDANGCSKQTTHTVSTIANPVATVDSVKNVSCFGGSDGIIYLTASSGTSPYTYLWSTGANTQNLVNVATGNYTVTVTDANSCTSQATVFVSQPAAALNDSVQVTNATCGNNNGSLTIFPFNGTSPYTYLWSNAATSQTISSLSPGLYTVTITDANSCSRQRVASISNVSGPALVLDSVRTVKCFGGSTGGIFISVTGGTPGFTYQWSTSASSQDLVNVAAGTYTVTVTDANNCTATLSATVSQTATAVNDSIQASNASCGATTGSATVFPYGGTPGYSVLWSTGSGSNTIFNLGAGTYTVTITDALGCTKVDFVNITNTAPPVVGIDSIVNVKCFGQSNGGIFISVSGGAVPYTYQWSNSTSSQDLTNVPIGIYTVTVTDANNCSAVVSSSITQPAVLNNTLNITNATCGFANGEITAQPSGGTSPYTYLWNNSQTSQTITGLFQGNYTVTVTDLNGCTKITSGAVNNSNGPQIVLDSIVDVLCNGAPTGAIYTTISGGTPPLTILWSNSQGTDDINALTAGTYTVTVTDQNNCSIQASYDVLEPPVLNDSASVTPATCGLNNGSVTVYPFGGVSPYSYAWSNLQSTQTITGLSGGLYTVTITDSVGCTRNNSFNVQSSTQPVIVTDSIVHVKCNGQSTGAIYVNITGGTLPLTYNWSNGNPGEDNLNLAAGTYTLTVTDAYQCTVSGSFTINQPTAMQDSLNKNPATCNLNNGSAKIYPYGGTPGYTYLWSNLQTSQTAINLAPGVHTVTVTDANGCTLVRNVTIVSIPVQVISLDSLFNVNCNGGSTGAIYISVSSGAAPYTYVWSNSQATQDITNIAAGTYTVTVTDSVNCSVSQSWTIQESTPISVSGNVTDATCGLPNGSISVSPSGGTPGYEFLWSNLAITPAISGLDPGVYTVTITDFFGCTFVDSYTVIDIPGPDITLDSLFDAVCFNGSDGAIYISVTNGTPNFTYLWSNNAVTEDITGLSAGSYTITVTDQNNCTRQETYTIDQGTPIDDGDVITDATCGSSNGSIALTPSGGIGSYTFVWSNSATTSAISNLPPDVYSVTITDSLGCSGQFQYTINNLGAPQIAIDSLQQVNCAGDSTGAIFISITGGASPYTYNWSNFVSAEDLTLIPAGSYTVTVTDQNNCTATISAVINEPPPISVTFDVVPANCGIANGSVEATISGGTGIYTLLWSNFSNSQIITNLAAGSYTLTVTDQNNCVESFVASVSNLSAPVISVVDSGNVSCFGLTNGFITVDVTGGQAPYNYSWTNTPQSGNMLTNLAGNVTYTLTITDSLGCIAIRPVFISQPPAIVINAIIPQRNDTFNLTCAGSDDGSIKVVTSGGIAPYSYIWSNLSLADSIGALAAGAYTVTVTDANGCTQSRSFTITEPPLLVSNAGQSNVICGVNSDTLNASPPAFGTGYWNIVSGSAIFSDSTDHNAVVTELQNGVNIFQWVVTDGICSAVSQVVITYNTQIFAIPGNNRDVCADSVLLTATSPQFGNGYWQIVNSTGTIADTAKAVTWVTGLNPGVNVFKWIVVNGTCRDTANLVIFLNDPAACIEDVELPTGFTPNNDGKNDYFVIKGIEEYADNTFEVYNRWGNRVYEKSGYSNEWDGVNQNGEPLPEGTYFIIFKIRQIDLIRKTYVDLRR